MSQSSESILVHPLIDPRKPTNLQLCGHAGRALVILRVLIELNTKVEAEVFEFVLGVSVANRCELSDRSSWTGRTRSYFWPKASQRAYLSTVMVGMMGEANSEPPTCLEKLSWQVGQQTTFSNLVRK